MTEGEHERKELRDARYHPELSSKASLKSLGIHWANLHLRPR